ncbi:transcription antitermination factor NusB [Ruminococcus sp.]|uniref:transcription antitermination factor NusB n=1 Tax=Ruminococcus sp. TaxID=41978 RepID=UPI0025ECE1B1|nr:transcription antitermination factor NusB [Ruminococcus sp.]
MPITRREIRESAFLLSFEKMFRPDEELDDIFMFAMEIDELPVTDDVKKLVEGVYEKQEELDEIIGKFSNKRAVSRIPKINLALLRLAIYESMYDEKVPVNVAISEAVALAGKYALEPDVSFVNGVLGSFSKSQEADK